VDGSLFNVALFRDFEIKSWGMQSVCGQQKNGITAMIYVFCANWLDCILQLGGCENYGGMNCPNECTSAGKSGFLEVTV